ncbi:uncharacterized protein LOC116345349 [Contarinia nasturtii]|uniref:uncharacterized protein LOC116345349 n=1 Tax=Contarinia nasturtii TaxID=265458 RepID=UPI0012D462A7|nr:uncharacterized protein LOC116345349 [Contarinia nasturtii]
MKITDMTSECIGKCLNYLSFDDLLRAAISNKKLNNAANLIYEQKYRSKRVEMHILSRLHSNYFMTENRFCFYSLRTSFQFLFCFGRQVNEIHISYIPRYVIPGENGVQNENNVELTHRAIDYANDYCAESLRTIKFTRIQDASRYMKRPFINLENLEFYDCNFTDLVEYNLLNALFPKVQKLVLKTINKNLDQPCTLKFIEGRFAHLKSLHIESNSYSKFHHADEYCILKGNLVTAFRLNPQLKELDLDLFVNCHVFQSNDVLLVINYLQNLDSLSLAIDDTFCSLLDSSVPPLMYFRNLKKFSLNMQLSTESRAIQFTSHQLDTFELHGVDRFTNYEYEFLEKHPTITKLILRGGHFERLNLSRIAAALPILEQLMIFDHFKLKIEEIVPHWSKFQSLKLLCFFHTKIVKDSDLKPLLINGWHGRFCNSPNKFQIILKR